MSICVVGLFILSHPKTNDSNTIHARKIHDFSIKVKEKNNPCLIASIVFIVVTHDTYLYLFCIIFFFAIIVDFYLLSALSFFEVLRWSLWWSRIRGRIGVWKEGTLSSSFKENIFNQFIHRVYNR